VLTLQIVSFGLSQLTAWTHRHLGNSISLKGLGGTALGVGANLEVNGTEVRNFNPLLFKKLLQDKNQVSEISLTSQSA
jgi:hypothetical protein